MKDREILEIKCPNAIKISLEHNLFFLTRIWFNSNPPQSSPETSARDEELPVDDGVDPAGGSSPRRTARPWVEIQARVLLFFGPKNRPQIWPECYDYENGNGQI